MQIEPPCIQLEVLRLLRADAATRLVNAWSRVEQFSIDMPHEAFHAPCFQTRVVSLCKEIRQSIGMCAT